MFLKLGYALSQILTAFVFQQCVQNGHTFSSIVHGDIELALCQAANTAGLQLAEKLLKTEAAEILKEAKEQTAKAVLEEKARKDKLKQQE